MSILSGDVESKQTLDELVDRLRDEIVNPALAKMDALLAESYSWRVLAERLNLSAPKGGQ